MDAPTRQPTSLVYRSRGFPLQIFSQLRIISKLYLLSVRWKWFFVEAVAAAELLIERECKDGSSWAGSGSWEDGTECIVLTPRVLLRTRPKNGCRSAFEGDIRSSGLSVNIRTIKSTNKEYSARKWEGIDSLSNPRRLSIVARRWECGETGDDGAGEMELPNGTLASEGVGVGDAECALGFVLFSSS